LWTEKLSCQTADILWRYLWKNKECLQCYWSMWDTDIVHSKNLYAFCAFLQFIPLKIINRTPQYKRKSEKKEFHKLSQCSKFYFNTVKLKQDIF
jgi:hypothetical protein